jgi:hypothetical protein
MGIINAQPGERCFFVDFKLRRCGESQQAGGGKQEKTFHEGDGCSNLGQAANDSKLPRAFFLSLKQFIS